MNLLKNFILLITFVLITLQSCSKNDSPSNIKTNNEQDTNADYLNFISKFEVFKDLSVEAPVPGLGTLSTVKFLINNEDGKIYFINSKRFNTHYSFVTKVLNYPINIPTYTEYAYGENSKRKFIVGSIIFYQHLILDSDHAGAYSLEFYPTDNVSLDNIKFAFENLKSKIPLDRKFIYRPSSAWQEEIAKKNSDFFNLANIRLVFNSEIFKNLEYLVMNSGVTGKAYGYLRYIGEGSSSPIEIDDLTFKDIAIFEKMPIDVGVLSGIITEEFQTPLSHINIKSKARGTINLVYPNAHSNSKFSEKIGRLVSINVNDNQVLIEDAKLEDAMAYWDSLKKKLPPLVSDLSEKRLLSSNLMKFSDSKSYGAKAANYAEIANLNPKYVKSSFGIPFYYYDQFMNQNNLWNEVNEILNNEKIINDRGKLIKALKKLRKKIENGVVEEILLQSLEVKLQDEFDQLKMRFRSSTNSEDLMGFNGAGLYDSTSYVPNDEKKTIERALKKVWASVWNLRAFDEREFFSMNHKEVYMGILVSPAFSDEKANGVLITQNIFSPDPDTLYSYVNSQFGEESVTNPNPGITSDESLSIYRNIEGVFDFSHQYIRFSNIAPSSPILTQEELENLIKIADGMNRHFKKYFDKDNLNPLFSIDLEFKIDEESDGSRKIYVKQARPYIIEN